MIHGQEVNLLIRGPGIFDRGPVKAVRRMMQNRRNNSAARAYINKVEMLYIFDVQKLHKFDREEALVVKVDLRPGPREPRVPLVRVSCTAD